VDVGLGQQVADGIVEILEEEAVLVNEFRGDQAMRLRVVAGLD
jgi:hypothetical protein